MSERSYHGATSRSHYLIRQDNIQMFNKSIFSSIEQEKSKIQKQIIQKQICQVAVSIIISNLFVSVALISLVLYLKKDKFYLKFVFIICLLLYSIPF